MSCGSEEEILFECSIFIKTPSIIHSNPFLYTRFPCNPATLTPASIEAVAPSEAKPFVLLDDSVTTVAFTGVVNNEYIAVLRLPLPKEKILKSMLNQDTTALRLIGIKQDKALDSAALVASDSKLFWTYGKPAEDYSNLTVGNHWVETAAGRILANNDKFEADTDYVLKFAVKNRVANGTPTVAEDQDTSASADILTATLALGRATPYGVAVPAHQVETDIKSLTALSGIGTTKIF